MKSLLVFFLALATVSAAEFPPLGSAKSESGQLVSIDFILRKGTYRLTDGQLRDFRLPPFASVRYLNAEADLREIPIGATMTFSRLPDGTVAVMEDDFSKGVVLKLEKAEGNLLVSGATQLPVTPATRFWKGDQPAKLEDLKPGDELLHNSAGTAARDVWIGADTHRQVTEKQRAKFIEFTKARGVPAWVEKTDATTVTATVIGDPELFKSAFQDAFVLGKSARLCVANQELRTWNPPVDGENSGILEVASVPVEGYGSTGVRLTLRPPNMLEGFRRGRIVRIFGNGWPAKDQFYGESLMGYGYGRLTCQDLMENPAQEYPDQFPFRTDYGNPHLPWFQLKPGQAPPPFSGHLVLGDLISPSQFTDAQTGQAVDFTLIPEGKVRYLNADATLADIPTGTRCRFSMYQDSKGAFTQAGQITDEFSYLASNGVSYRIDAILPGVLQVAWQLPQVKNYNGDMESPPDIGRSELKVTDTTRVWKTDKELKVTDLAVGDVMVVNFSGGDCTEIWVGADTQKAASEAQQKKWKKPTK